MDAFTGEAHLTLHRVALWPGWRLGVALGLAGADVDLDAGTLCIRHALQRANGGLVLKAPKTEKSRRT